MTRIAIAYHSGYGHTEALAASVAQGVRDAGAEAILLRIDNAGQDFDPLLDEITASDAVVFGAPTYMGDVSGVFKVFADATSKAFFTGAWKDKLAAGFTNSATINGDKAGTINYFVTLSQQHGMFWVGTGMKAPNAKHHTRDDINHLGGYAGLITATPSDASVDEMVPGDLATARAFGERIAQAATRFA